MANRVKEFLPSFPHEMDIGAVEESVRRAGIGTIVSGGQTGTDRAAFDTAIRHSIPYAGFAPRGFIDEEGLIPEVYRGRMREPGSPWEIKGAADVFAERTELNVIHSHATLVLSPGEPVGGTLLTVEYAKRHGRPLLLLDLMDWKNAGEAFCRWASEHQVTVLNIAGPRESLSPGRIYCRSMELLGVLFSQK